MLHMDEFSSKTACVTTRKIKISEKFWMSFPWFANKGYRDGGLEMLDCLVRGHDFKSVFPARGFDPSVVVFYFYGTEMVTDGLWLIVYDISGRKIAPWSVDRAENP